MRRILDVVKSRWFLTLIGALALIAIVWLVGPLIAIGSVRPLEPEIVRLIVVILILVGWGLDIMFRMRRARARDEGLVKEMAASSGAPAHSAAGAGEVAQIEQRFREATELLKSRVKAGRFSQRFLYELPWYIMIGPPGTGKTTAIENSGLDFPLADKLGGGAVKGVGGTRNCDWWFTNDAVLIDTAGRYTTQDSDAQVDREAWLGFLKLLKRTRPRQPINGAMLTVSVDALLTMSDAELSQHALAMRQRIQELIRELGIRVPVYLLVTKADLIAGFVEYFDEFGKQERAQVLGTTFPLDRAKLKSAADDSEIGKLPAEFDLLVQGLESRMIDRLHRETDAERRARILGFPAQFAAIKRRLNDLVADVFRASRYDVAPLLRGVYMISGTQEGAPIDRLMASVSATFGVDRPSLPSFVGTGRSYFITQLLQDVVFKEANLVSADPKVESRQRLFHYLGYAAAAVVLLGMKGLWTMSYFNNQALVGQVQEAFDALKPSFDPAATAPEPMNELVRLAPALDKLRALPTGYDSRESRDAPWDYGFGLWQGEKLGSQAEEAYLRALHTRYLPALQGAMAQRVAAESARPDQLYNWLKVYLMLGRQGPVDAELIRQFVAVDMVQRLPGPPYAPIRESLDRHLGTLLATSFPAAPVDQALVDRARGVLRTQPSAARAYGNIQRGLAQKNLQDWRVIDHAGPAAPRALQRRSGKGLTDGIPGLYTAAGFREFMRALDDAAKQEVGEAWVVGEGARSVEDARRIDQVRRDILGLYQNEYVTHWDGLLTDLMVVPLQNRVQAMEILNALGGPQSPLKLVLAAVAKETQLTAISLAPELPPGVAQAAGAAAQGAAAARPPANPQVQSMVQALTGGQRPDPPGSLVEQRFANIQRLVAAQGGVAPIDDVLNSLNGIYVQLTAATDDTTAMGGALQGLRNVAAKLPPPVNVWLSAVAQAGSRVTAGELRQKMNAAWTANVVPTCKSAIEGRYPVFPNSPQDIGIEDFARFFGPGGVVQTFFDQNLKNYVDTSQRQWRWKQVSEAELGASRDTLIQVQRAMKIRETFFPGGATRPSFRFELVPMTLDPSVEEVVVEADGQALSYKHGPIRPFGMEWPKRPGGNAARISMLPPVAGQSTISREGPWAILRLIDEGQIDPGPSPERMKVAFDIGGRKASFELRAASVNNPFLMQELREFQCPPSL
ncbi:MAG: type VI secretion system membrane subunit TssM [Rhodospirillaceae bacterium]